MQNALELNFHHLRYFWAVAQDGQLTRTAARLHVAPSALSAQIRQLEEHLGEPLFTRDGRRLALTEAGQIAYAYAETIFQNGSQLVATLKQGGVQKEQHFRIGTVASFSRNFVRSFVRPLIESQTVKLRLETGGFDELLERLEAHELDLVLSNRQPPRGPERRYRSRTLMRLPVSVVASYKKPRFRFPRGLEGQPMILPGGDSELRGDIDSLLEREGVKVDVIAEVDDSPMIRLLTRDTTALAVVPTIVVREELEQGILHELCEVPDMSLAFYAITVERTFQHPLLRMLLSRDEAAMLALPSAPVKR